MKKLFVLFLIVFSYSSLYSWEHEAFFKYKRVSSYRDLDSAIVPWVEKINGYDRWHFRGKLLKIPVSADVAEKYCPVPTYLSDFTEIDSLIIISKGDARFAVYRYGELTHWGPITCGNFTPCGLFYLGYHDRWKRSKKHHNAPMFFSRYVCGNIFIHHGSIVGKRGSLGCIRLLERDAEWLFSWAPIGFPGKIIEESLNDLEIVETSKR